MQAKQLQEYKNKVVTAFHTRRMRMLEDNTDRTTVFFDPIRILHDENFFRLSATQSQELLTRLTKENIVNTIVEVSIQTFENEGMSGDCLVGIVNDWYLLKTSRGFYVEVWCAVTGLSHPDRRQSR